MIRNDSLAEPYQRLFASIDTLIMLAAPNFEIVATWRSEQEVKLMGVFDSRKKVSISIMNRAGIGRFVLH